MTQSPRDQIATKIPHRRDDASFLVWKLSMWVATFIEQAELSMEGPAAYTLAEARQFLEQQNGEKI